MKLTQGTLKSASSKHLWAISHVRPVSYLSLKVRLKPHRMTDGGDSARLKLPCDGLASVPHVLCPIWGEFLKRNFSWANRRGGTPLRGCQRPTAAPSVVCIHFPPYNCERTRPSRHLSTWHCNPLNNWSNGSTSFHVTSAPLPLWLIICSNPNFHINWLVFFL